MRIVAAIDGSPHADHALAWAIAAARRHGASLTVVHAVAGVRTGDDADDDGQFGRAVELVRDALERVPGGDVDPSIEVAPVRTGGVGEAVLDAASDADLLVIGSRGRGGFTGLLLGSVSQHIAARATAPVAIIPPAGASSEAVRANDDGGSTIVVGVDGSACSRRALAWAADEARVRGSTVDAIRVMHPIDAVMADLTGTALEVLQRRATERAMASLVELVDDELGVDRDAVTPHVTIGSPAHVLVAHARASSSLLVVGSRGRGGFAGLLLGSVSRQCIMHANGPVVVVHAP